MKAPQKKKKEEIKLKNESPKRCKTAPKEKKVVEKSSIIKYVESATSITLTNKVLVDILPVRDQQSEFNSVGRGNVPGSSKSQMRHVIACALTENLIKSVSTSEPSKTAITDFIKIFRVLLNHKEGYCFSSETFKEDPRYKELASEVPKITKKILRTKSVDSFLVSPEKIKSTTFSPNKKSKAETEFKNLYIKYVELAMGKLADAIDDPNTTVIAMETVSKLLLGYVNTVVGVAFPEEGNTQNFEIRLYANKEAAKNPKNKTYKLISAKELKEMHASTGKVTEKVRIVDCEGSNIVKVLKSLRGLSEIVGKHFAAKSATEQVKAYNSIGDLQLVLANNNSAIAEYNEKLTEKNYLKKTCYQLAKLIYFAFDFKALEESVLIPSISKNNNISVYKSSGGSTLTDYCFAEGCKYRKDAIIAAKKVKGKYTSQAKFREEETDLSFLEKKLVVNFVICTLPYKEFSSGFSEKDEFLDNALVALFKLVAIDHVLEKTKEEELLKQARIDYLDLTTDRHSEINLSNSQIELKIEGHDFSQILGEQNLFEDI